MKTNFDIGFWKTKFAKHFELNETGKELLSQLIYSNKEAAIQLMKDCYDRKFYKEDFIDMFCDKYDKEQINTLLKQLDYEPLTDEEIETYKIKENELEMEE